MKKRVAWLDEKDTITIEVPKSESLEASLPHVYVGNSPCMIKSVGFLDENTAQITLEDPFSLECVASLSWGGDEWQIYLRKVVRSAWFDQTYDCTDEKLGCSYFADRSEFAVWAPTARKVELVIETETFQMERKANGVWYIAVEGDWKNMPYHFVVAINGEVQKVNDPYAKSMTANSERGVVIDLPATDPDSFRAGSYPKVEKQDAIIYELHIRDATISLDSGVSQKGKFLGLTEEHTKNTAGYSTALSYIKELGCTHVQLLPLQDFARVDELKPEDSYNWGYDPLYYLTPEGSYATDANNPEVRIRECKQMIEAIHKNGMSVILDVVYNHVFDQANSAFEKLVPGYYFRYREDGSLSDGSGTGNDMATERKMVRKFILDAIDYWLDEYHVDGFRFDLMGLIDLETMQQIQQRCLKADRPILLLGEGWELDTELDAKERATAAQSMKLEGVSFFNDVFRDHIKGKVFLSSDAGYINGSGKFLELLPQLVTGSCDERYGHPLFSTPLQSVNFVECHDNHTLWDRLVLSNHELTEESRKKVHQLATGLTILSQGIPFLHAGQEFFRTKKDDGNSYISADEVNQLDWTSRGREEESIQWVRILLGIRKKYRVFRLDSKKEIQKRVHIIPAPHPVFGYMLMGTSLDFAIFINPTASVMNITMPNQGRWEKLSSNHACSLSPISCLLSATTEIGAYEFSVWRRSRVKL
ncbi:type I pullulanase [Saliterribacillus persicus]|uniref:Pullulanase n=1 Tax=Saliterribacillus persicus TaxID=930114 RepID=A0A368Y9K3_9BACI|nr:type I pullulanase [Saliterribacillus persicus]RCW76950.1 pullulanase [Saliterribacillus persicus]